MGRSLTAWFLVAVMAIGSILLWLGVPAFWIWLASQLADSSQPSMGLYLMVLVGIIGSMFVIGKGLGMLNHTHAHLTDTLPDKREQTVWMRSMRGEREYTRNSGVLGTVMVISVTLALISLGVWFFLFAEGGGI